jgi:hypothetical protein
MQSDETDVSEEHLPPSLRSKNKQNLSPAFRLVSCLAYSSKLKMEATCSSETSVDFE